MAARRLARQGGLSPEEIMEALFARDPEPTVSDEEGMPNDDTSDRECHYEDAFPLAHQEEVDEILLTLQNDELTEFNMELDMDAALVVVMDQSALDAIEGPHRLQQGQGQQEGQGQQIKQIQQI